MRNIIAIAFTLLIVGLMAYTFSQGRAFQGGEAGNIIEDIKTMSTPQNSNEKPQVKQGKDEDQEKLDALRDKAGNASLFEVSNEYKSKCSSCHGVDGSGVQNGKKLMGPKLIGQEEDKLYKDLVDFKIGKKENLIMKGLLIHLEDEDLRNFAKEIAGFKLKQESLNK
jgi:cytochrome c553